MKFFLRWTAVLATLIMLSLSTQVLGSSEFTPMSPEMKAQKLEQAFTNAADKNGDGVLSEKEMKYRDKLSAKYSKFSDRMNAKIAKREAKGKKTNMSKLGLGLVLWGVALLLYILGAVLFTTTLGGGFGGAAILYLLGSLAGLAGTVLIIWGLVEMAG